MGMDPKKGNGREKYPYLLSEGDFPAFDIPFAFGIAPLESDFLMADCELIHKSLAWSNRSLLFSCGIIP
jgi:hypothetical protein